MTSRNAKNKRIIWAPTSWSIYEVDAGHEYVEELAAKTNTPLAAILDGLQQAGAARSLSFVRIIDMNPIEDEEDGKEFFIDEEPS